MSETTLLPEIRINGFKEAWKAYELKDLCSLITKQTGFDYSATIKPSLLRDGNENTYSFIQNKDFLGTKINLNTDFYIPKKIAEKFPNILLDRPSILISISGKIGNAGLYKLSQKAFIGGAVGICKLTDEADGLVTLYNLLSGAGQRYFQTLIKASSHSNITVEDIRKIKIYLPSSNEEKNRIGTFFSGIDEFISLNKAKLEKLSNLKKAMLEKMFPKQSADVPEIRFKGFAGAWEKKQLGETFAYISNNTLSRAQLNYEFGLAKNVHYGDVLIKFGELIDAEKEELPFITDNDLATKYKPAQLQNGDVIIADAAEDESVGKCCEVINVANQIIVSGLHTIAIRPLQTFAPKFLGYFMNSVAYHSQLLRLMQGTKVLSISKTAIKETFIYFPSKIEEQEKIGSYFQNLDKTISLHQTELEKLNNLKKACLEKMFV